MVDLCVQVWLVLKCNNNEFTINYQTQQCKKRQLCCYDSLPSNLAKGLFTLVSLDPAGLELSSIIVNSLK